MTFFPSWCDNVRYVNDIVRKSTIKKSHFVFSYHSITSKKHSGNNITLKERDRERIENGDTKLARRELDRRIVLLYRKPVAVMISNAFPGVNAIGIYCPLFSRAILYPTSHARADWRSKHLDFSDAP